MPFEYLDGLTAADVAFRARGESLDELFAAAWQATLEVMLEADPDAPSALRTRVRRRIRLEEPSPELLLHAFLEEQLFLKDAQGVLLRLESCRVDRRRVHSGSGGDERWQVRATAAGERPNPERHRLGTDVKAVTWHRFALQRGQGGWQATVILDV